jgi:4-amino-4-deoxy-L-arabinose transferase-like glycosyltransferase
MKRDRNTVFIYLVLTSILLFALISRLSYLTSYLDHNPFSGILIVDSSEYDLWAKAIIEGEIFEASAFYRAPAYPYFLAIIYWLFGPFLPVVYIIQMVVGIISIFLLFILTKRYFNEKVALISCFIFSLYGTTIFFESKLLPETIAIAVNILFLYVLSNYYQESREQKGFPRFFLLWFSGCLLGLSCLIRPNMLLMVPCVGLWLIFFADQGKLCDELSWRSEINKKLSHVLILTIGTLLIIFPLTLRNYLQSGDFVLISLNGGLTFSQGNNAHAEGVFAAFPGFTGNIQDQRLEERYYAQAEEGKKLSDKAISRFWYRKGLRFIKENPIQWLVLEAKKFFYFFDDYEHSLEYSYTVESSYMANISILPFGMIIPLALFGILATFPWKGKTLLMLYLLVQFLTVMIFYMSSRYRLPATPVLCVFSGYGLYYLVELFRKKSTQKAIFSIIILVAVGIFSFMKIGDIYLFEESSAYGNLGTAFNALGLYDEALSSFEKQRELDPESAYALFNLGVVLSKMGKEDEAANYYEEAIKVDPSFTSAYNNLGVLLLQRGDCSKAEPLFLKAVNIKPFITNPYINLFTCYLLKGNIKKAQEIKNMADLQGVKMPQELERKLQNILNGNSL